MKLLLEYLNKLGTEHNLDFSVQEILKHCIIGLDEKKKKVLIVNNNPDNLPGYYIIDLNEVSRSSVKKYYGRIKVNGLVSRGLNQYLEKMDLQIEFLSEKQPADILIYKQIDNDIRELPKLEFKARKWMELISRISPNSLTKEKRPLELEK